MGMKGGDEESLREFGSLEAARLALRGALATIRDLQDLNARLKAQAQEELSRGKQSQARIEELTAQIRSWEEERRARAADEEKWKREARLQVREEEKARLEESRRGMEEDLAGLQGEIETMAAAQRRKEDGFIELKKELEAREAELLKARREKLEAENRRQRDLELLAEARERRDKEIAASLRGRGIELEDLRKELASLRQENEELRQHAAASSREMELRLEEREERLLRECRLKEQALHERYSRRGAELESSWAELENGLWRRTKEAREKLDRAAVEQFEERARALAGRAGEIEDILSSRKKELEEGFKGWKEALLAEQARREKDLDEKWAAREGQLVRHYEELLEEQRNRFALELRRTGEELRKSRQDPHGA